MFFERLTCEHVEEQVVASRADDFLPYQMLLAALVRLTLALQELEADAVHPCGVVKATLLVFAGLQLLAEVAESGSVLGLHLGL